MERALQNSGAILRMGVRREIFTCLICELSENQSIPLRKKYAFVSKGEVGLYLCVQL